MDRNKKPGKNLDLISNIDLMIHSKSRLMIITYLYVVEKMDYVYLKRVTGLSWGNLSKNITKLEEAGLVETEKKFEDKKPKTIIWLTQHGRESFREYKENLEIIFNSLPTD
jgi:DNA-binding MarR family transcriptional regulator